MAVAEGEARVKALSKGEGSVGEWSASRVVQRGPGLPRELIRTVFGMPSDTLPSYAGAQTPNGGFVIAKLEKVTKTEVKADDPRLQPARGQYQQLLGKLELNGYLTQLRARYAVEIAPAAIKDATE